MEGVTVESKEYVPFRVLSCALSMPRRCWALFCHAPKDRRCGRRQVARRIGMLRSSTFWLVSDGQADVMVGSKEWKAIG